MSWHKLCNRRFLAQPGTNDASAYGVHVQPHAAVGLAAVMRCIGVHHLTPGENRGNHHIYLDVLDEDGGRLEGAVVCYTWQGHRGDPLRVLCDKADHEPAANIPIWPGQVINLWVETGQAGDASDRVTGIHTAHPDEGAGNTRYHHSFYVVFQVRRLALPQPNEAPVPLAEVLHDLLTRLHRIREDAQAIAETLQKL